MLGLNVSYLKYILLAVLLYGLVLVVNNKLLKNDEQKDGFKTEKEEELTNVVDKLNGVTDKLSELVEKFETMNGSDEDVEDEEDDEDDEDDEMDVDVEKPKRKTESFKKDKKHKAKKHLNHKKEPETEPFTNYTTGVSSAFGGDYLLLDH
jgi:hypothetical protein